MTSATRVILADDLTGASDAAVAFARLGVRTDVWLDRPGESAEAEVVAVDLDTRALPPAAAAARVAALLQALPPAARVIKKIDSTLRGNIAAETAALLAARPGRVALVVPAHPKYGRVQRDGELLVDGRPVHDSDFGRDLFTPVRSSDVRRHLPAGETSLVAAPALLGEAGALARAVASAARKGARAIAIDAESEDDLRAVARLATDDERYLCVGSAGLLEALAHCSYAPEPRPAPSGTPLVAPVLFVVGSLSAMTHAQIARFTGSGGATEMVDPRTILIDEGGARSRAIGARIAGGLAAGRDVLVALSSDRTDVEAALSMGRLHGFDVTSTSRELRERFVELVAPLVAQAGTILLSGADVARTFFMTAGIAGLRLIGEPAAGIPLGRAYGSGTLVVPKAGGAGTAETYRDIARAAVPA